MGKNLLFLRDACLVFLEKIRTDRQIAEVAQIYKNENTDVALVVTDAEKKKAHCFATCESKTCAAGIRACSRTCRA